MNENFNTVQRKTDTKHPLTQHIIEIASTKFLHRVTYSPTKSRTSAMNLSTRTATQSKHSLRSLLSLNIHAT